MWTMEQLVERVQAALAGEYPGAPNGRVRELPDRRSIRWYSTIGLVDRPLGTRGRTALYGPRHLLQLVAIKRRQATGRTLAEIQAELTGASDEELAAAARVPPELLIADTDSGAGPPPAGPPARTGFWKHSATRAPVPGSAEAEPFAPAGTTTREVLAEAVRREREARGDRRPLAGADFVLSGVPLGLGVILLVPQPIDDLDRGEIAAAARPLLDLLASRGLTDGRDT